MARIIYGVSGEGSGHSSRARVILDHLIGQGHTVKVVSYDRGFRNLREDFDVFETEGLHIASADNRVSMVKTFTDNLQRLPQGHRKLQDLRRLFRDLRPDCAITDFEPMTAYLARHYDLPLISIDNQHRMRYMNYPSPPGLSRDRLLTENIIRAMVPSPDFALVTTFFYGQALNARTFLLPPILREEVLAQRSSRREHILVYLTSGFETFLEHLRSFARERFVVYGYERDQTEGNLTFRPFSRTGFLADLASCQAVMATAGFTLMTEALFLGKPYLALPMRGQFEQELNGFLLAKLGYGMNLRRASPEAIASFLYHLPEYREALKSYRAEDNSAIKTKLDELLADGAAGAKAFRKGGGGPAEPREAGGFCRKGGRV